MADILRQLNRPSWGSFMKASASRLHMSAVQLSSPFIKAQKKMDPEIAKLREERKRRKLKKEIKLLESFGKKPKPVEEYIFDKKHEANINERIRPNIRLNENEEDERVILEMEYKRYLNKLAVMDTRWITESIRKQENALQKLKALYYGCQLLIVILVYIRFGRPRCYHPKCTKLLLNLMNVFCKASSIKAQH
ncbi:Mitochondrial ribosomal protein L28 family protein [Acanthocheilonema viteae]